MRLVALEYVAFGCFSGVRLDFGDNGKNFHLIHGNNEAGKSTALRGLTNLFYGIPPRTADVFRHDGPNLRISAELQRSDGRRLTITRRKGQQKTLLDAADQPLPERALTEMLGGVSEEAFTAIYRLDHEALVRGGSDLRDGRGDLAESLFQAGAGIAGLRKMLKDLEADADEIFKPRAHQPLINCAIEKYQLARKESREASIRPSDWTKKQEELGALLAGRDRHQDELRRLRAEQKRLERLRLAWPHAAKLQLLRSEAAGLGAVTLLPESASREREDAERRRDEACAREAEARREVERLEVEIATLHAPEALLGRAVAITALNQCLGGYQQAMTDLPLVRAEERGARREAEAILRDLGDWSGDGNGTSGPAHLSAVERDRVEWLAGQYPALQQRAQDTAERAIAAAEECAQGRALLDSERPVLDPAGLRRALERAQKDGDLEGALREARTKLAALQQQAGLEISRLGRWQGRDADLEKVPVPAMETVDRFDAEFAQLDAARLQAERRLGEAQEKARRIEAQIRAVQSGHELPTEGELKAKREHREQGWRLVRRSWLEGGDDSSEARRFHPAKPLPDAYEEAVAEADAVADRLWREADRVARLTHLQAASEEERKRLCELERECARLASEKGTLAEQWEQAWAPSAIQPATPREMRGWLGRYAGVLAKTGAVREQAITVQMLESLAHRRAAGIRETMVALGEHVPAGLGLDFLIDGGRELLSRIEQAQTRRDVLAREVKRRFNECEKAERAKGQAAESLIAWGAQWGAAIEPLGLGPGLDPSQAVAILRRIDVYRQKTRDAQHCSERIAGMETSVAQFRKNVADLVFGVAPDLRGLPADQAAATLQDRLAQAQRVAERRKALEQQLAQAHEVIAQSEANARKAGANLESLMRRAGCSTRDGLLAEEEKTARARRLSAEIEQVMRTLAPMAGGGPLETLLAELASVDQDRLSLECDELAPQIAAQEAALLELQMAIGKFQSELNAMDGSGRAAEAAEQAHQTGAEIESLAARYLRLRLACGILRRQIEIYREENQGPLVHRASAIFSKLTRHSFAALKVGFDEKDRPVLIGVRPSEEEVTVTGMSEGTRDQLYLALRLASLERQLESGEPIPFIVDDILMSFDNDRAGATLQVLAELCAKTQVLFFTHHSHLAKLAGEAVPAELLEVHRLGPCTAA